MMSLFGLLFWFSSLLLAEHLTILTKLGRVSAIYIYINDRGMSLPLPLKQKDVFFLRLLLLLF